MALQPLGTGAGLFLVANPGSGRTKDRPDPVPILKERLPDATVHVLSEGEELGAVLRAALASTPAPTVLGVCGGDGSVSAGAAVALETGLPLLVLPGGTYNHFSRLIGIETIDDALAAGDAGTGGGVDLARFAGNGTDPVLVINTLVIGLYPEFVRLRVKFEPRIGRPLATLVAAIGTFFRSAPVQMRIEDRAVWIWALFVGVSSYTPKSGPPRERDGFDTGELDVRLLRSGLSERVSGLVGLLRSGGDRSQLGPRTERLRQMRVPSVELRGRAGRSAGLAHDGETVEATSEGPYRGTITCLPKAIEVYFPAKG